MKTNPVYILFFFLPLFLLSLSSCRHEDEDELSQTGETESLTISFDLPRAEPLHNGLPESRASESNAKAELLPANTLFSVRAYKRGKMGDESESSVFAGSGIYQVGADGTTAEPRSKEEGLTLNRETYNLYFLSYNSTSTVPDGNNETISVSNGNDFLGATLEKIVILANQEGQTNFTIPMDGHPFSHLCSRVKATLEIPEEQPVMPVKITDLNISVKNLHAANTYTWLSEAFTTWGERTDKNTIPLIASGSLDDINTSTTFPITLGSPSDFFLLPVDENEPLLFDVSMSVSYGGAEPAALKTENMELKKALLPGMSYNFVFSLTFYGTSLPTDLTLNVLSYEPVDLLPGDVGGDK